MRCFPPTAALTVEGADLVAAAANWALIAGDVEAGRQHLKRAQEAAPDSCTVGYMTCRFDQWGGLPYEQTRDRLVAIADLAESTGRTRDLFYAVGTLQVMACHARRGDDAADTADRLRGLGRSVDLANDIAVAFDLCFNYSLALVGHAHRSAGGDQFFANHYLLIGAVGAATAGAFGDAAELLVRALRSLRSTDTLELVTAALDQSAAWCASSGRSRAAWLLWGCVDAYYEHRSLVGRSAHPDYALYAVRAAELSDDTSYRFGRTMTLVEAVDLAVAELTASPLRDSVASAH
jgi:hypothetical protein